MAKPPFALQVCSDKLRPFEVVFPIEPIRGPNILQISNFLNRIGFIVWIRIARDGGFSGFGVLGGCHGEGREFAAIKAALSEIRDGKEWQR